jgi:hypothetical protein
LPLGAWFSRLVLKNAAERGKGVVSNVWYIVTQRQRSEVRSRMPEMRANV